MSRELQRTPNKEFKRSSHHELKRTRGGVVYAVQWAHHPYIGFFDPDNADASLSTFQIFRRFTVFFEGGSDAITFDKLGNATETQTGDPSTWGQVVGSAGDIPWTISDLNEDVDAMFAPSTIIAPFTDGLLAQTWYCGQQDIYCQRPLPPCGIHPFSVGYPLPGGAANVWPYSDVGDGVTRPYITIADTAGIHPIPFHPEVPIMYPVAYRNWSIAQQAFSEPSGAYCWNPAIGLNGGAVMVGWMQKSRTRLHDIPAYSDSVYDTNDSLLSCVTKDAITTGVVFDMNNLPGIGPQQTGYRNLAIGGSCV